MPNQLNTTGGALIPTRNPNPSTGYVPYTGSSALQNIPINFGTLPNIPQPVVPPPKQVAVVTPDLAQKDLETKKATTNAVAEAAAVQTQNKLSTGMTPNPATSQGQPTQGQDTTQGQPEGQGKGQPTAPAGSTTQQLLQLVNSGDVTLSADQVKQLAGIDFTGVHQNGDGTYTLDASAKQRVNQRNTFDANLPSTGDTTTDYILQQQSQNQKTLDDASARHQQQLSSLLNGTFPLTADQQAQVAGLQSQLEQLRSAQESANKNYQNAITILGIRAGRQQYAPGLQATLVSEAIDEGIQKIANLDIQAASAVATLKQGFYDNDYKLINESYDDLTATVKSKNDALKAMQDTIKAQVDMTTAKLNQQNIQLDIATKRLTQLAPVAYQSAVKADGTLDLDVIGQIAADQGLDPNTLYGAVVKEQRAQQVIDQQDAKFATDQLQAGAQLEATKASTANTRANTAKTQAETAATVASTSPNAQKERLTSALDLAKELRKDDATGKHSAVGASLAKLAVGAESLGLQPDRAAFEAKVNSLKSNLTLDNLKLLKGAMSDKDVAFLQSVATSLDTNMSETEFDAELDKVIQKLETATGVVDKVAEEPPQVVNGVTYVKHADGLYYPQ